METDDPCKIVVTGFDSPHLHQFAGIAQWQSGAVPRRRRGVRFPLSAPIRQRSSVAEPSAHNAQGEGSIPSAGTNYGAGRGRRTLSGSSSDIAGSPPTGSGPAPATNRPAWCRWSARPPEEREVLDHYEGRAPIRGGRPMGGYRASNPGMRVRLPSSAPALFQRRSRAGRRTVNPRIGVRILALEPNAGEVLRQHRRLQPGKMGFNSSHPCQCTVSQVV